MKKLDGLKRPVEREDELFIPELPGVALQEAPSSAGDMVERVARALCRVARRNPDEVVSGDYWTFTAEPIDYSLATPDVIYWEPRWKAYQRQARAALEAMREPTDAQLHSVCDPRNEHTQQAFADDWRAMIDAALSPLPEPPK